MTISIIIPVYQVEPYIEACLQSVMRQTYQGEMECLLIDDCGTDDSMAIAEKMISAYEGLISFRVIRHEKNRGLSAARNTGIDNATGDYIYFLDSDDEITPDCIERLVSYLHEDDSIEMVQGRYVTSDGEKEILGKSDEHRILNNDDAREQFLFWRKLNYTVWNKLLKRSFVLDNKLYNKEGIINEDLLWTFYLIKHLKNAQLCKEVTYFYRIRPESIISGGKEKKIGGSYVVIYDEILNNLTMGKEKGELKGLQSTFCMVLANYYRCTPELLPVVKLYKRQAKHYNCWNTVLILTIVALVSRFGNPLGLLKLLNGLRWKFKK